VNVKQIANQQQRKEKYVLEDEKQVLGLWCVAQTSCVDQKGFAKQRLDLSLKTWENHKNRLFNSKIKCRGQKRKRSKHRCKAKYKT